MTKECGISSCETSLSKNPSVKDLTRPKTLKNDPSGRKTLLLYNFLAMKGSNPIKNKWMKVVLSLCSSRRNFEKPGPVKASPQPIRSKDPYLRAWAQNCVREENPLGFRNWTCSNCAVRQTKIRSDRSDQSFFLPSDNGKQVYENPKAIVRECL